MKFLIFAVGNKMPEWVEAGFKEYARRMPHEAAIELLELRPEKRGEGKKVEQLLDAEGARILAALPPKCRIVAMDERGRQWTTAQLANSITGWMRNGGDTAFIVGGADGLDASIKNLADEVLALSALTLPHGLVRILLAEQLYRAVSLIKRHPYHRA
ncbi:23S rRNA (pseudouridine1915-N3)-methyltransferase [Nitrosospira sp. Nl5]|uniref:23S rRNA (pseudouridine(1915)-N(3))-methyltransferase RlmH n=1 Tax=Nitrosospira sp. Nl5 TaxID=200120 RepID=UPI0008832DB0|nr:23S rRNA (pseudouridine(1915)-N(3))-methyltransferase RlmH [Nitrosospira sp. Nl5]SCY55287.1 23S rRNA (pseudouridine1915-N3)-methyltransferase [Nitrosospira sp. Nl5]